MAEIKLTPSQQAVVDDRGGALLVSAAAGSGKTKVLVDRLLSRICDRENPCNLDDFLVITYTKAAASELRIKIAQALSEKLAENPGNRHLQRQMSRIYLASISTVHSFCSDILRSHAHLLDLSPDFRVAEEAESGALQDKVLERMLEQGYEELEPDFRAMVETFGYGRDDRRLPDAVKMTHREMRCRADMDGWLQNMLAALDMDHYEDASQTPWGAYLMEHFQEFLQQQILKLENGLKEMELYPRIQKGLEKCFQGNLEQLKMLAACSKWDEIVAKRVTEFGRAGVIREPEDVLVKERLGKVRSLCWTELKKWQEYFFAPSDTVLEDLRAVSQGTKALLRFAKSFDEAYGTEKKHRKLLDFSDLEHLAIALLTDKYTGKPTKIARDVADRFVEIMVDEYQDSNEVQDTIFEAVSKNGQNRFMVGDVKQSIYRFRLADPSLFLRKYLEYVPWREAEEGQPRKIMLSENFRSRGEILSACNDVFRLVMRKSVGDLDYTDDEALRQGRTFLPLDDPAVELHCLTHSDPGQDKSEMEAEYVAARIREMLDRETLISDGDEKRPVRPGDIAILMRSLSSTASDYLEALGRYGIPAVCDRGGSLLETSEVQILVAILQILDNPHQDIPLLTALGSPVFGFTPEQLAAPRTENRKDDYYDAMGQHEVFSDVLKIIESLREDSAWMSLHELVDQIFRKTGILNVFSAMDDGLRRERNLLAFRSFVVSFEAMGSRALPQLLWYLEDIQTAGGQVPIPKSAAENAVTIMSVHSSKGLEFPVVFLCDLSRKFNLQDMQDAILVDNDLAIGCNRVDHQRYVRYPTLAKKAIVHKKTREAVSEELRVLYVAMTRARERLVMTYYSRYLVSEMQTLNKLLTWPLSDDLCASARSPGKWILMAALCRTEAGELFAQCGNNEVSRVWDTCWDIRFCDLAELHQIGDFSSVEKHSFSAAVQEEELELLQYSYPYRNSCHIPAKLTATQLKGRVQDQEISEGSAERKQTTLSFRRPVFSQKTMTAAEVGTATHLFMQFADYAACGDERSLENELERLASALYLTAEQAAAVNREQILAFFSSDLGQWLLRQTIRREFKFSILVDPADYGLDAAGEQVLLQGVVDCFAEEEDGLTVVDFKTDRVADPERYRQQIEAYAGALAKIYQKPVKAKILYFFSERKAVYL